MLAKFTRYFRPRRLLSPSTAMNPAQPASISALDEDRLAWLALILSPGLGPRRIVEAMRQLDAPSQVFSLPLTSIEAMRFPAQAAQFLFDGKAREAAEREWESVHQQGAEIVTYSCAEYPERLKEIYDPPPVLWVRGDKTLLARPSIAIVGTRHPSPYGTGIAEMLARDLSARGMLVISGMARGIDTAAHKGTLAAGRPTVAVWGNRHRRDLSQRKQEACRGYSGNGRHRDLRTADGDFPGAAKLSPPQSNSLRAEYRRAGGGGERKFGHACDRPLRCRPGAGRFLPCPAT